MAAIHEELRDDLLAVIGAASELPSDEREHLADVFLDRLDAEYRLVPRAEATVEPRERTGTASRFPFTVSGGWPIVLGVLALAVLLPVLLMSAFVAVHPPILLIGILIFLVLRSRGWGPRRRMYR